MKIHTNPDGSNVAVPDTAVIGESAARVLLRRLAALTRAVADAAGARVTLETADGRVLEVFA